MNIYLCPECSEDIPGTDTAPAVVTCPHCGTVYRVDGDLDNDGRVIHTLFEVRVPV